MRSKIVPLLAAIPLLWAAVALAGPSAAGTPSSTIPVGSTLLEHPSSMAGNFAAAPSARRSGAHGIQSTTTILPAVRPVALRTMTLDSPTVPAMMAYDPQFDHYYGSHAGLTTYEGYVWDGTGALIQMLTPINIDGRSFYYNPNTDAVECIPFNSANAGVYAMGLDDAGLYTGVNIPILPPGIPSPSTQSGGAYDPTRDRLYMRSTTDLVTIVDRPSGLPIGTFNLDLAAAGSPTLQDGQIGYDPLFDRLIVLDTSNDRALVYDMSGSFVGASQLEPFMAGSDIAGCFGYANGQLFVQDYFSLTIRGYSIFSKEPAITAVQDLDNDQGRQVRITFSRSPLDVVNSPFPVVSYEIFRRIDPLPAPSAGAIRVADDSGRPAARPAAAMLAGWDDVASVPAFGDLEYNVVVPTLADSNGTGLNVSVFLVRALTATPGVYFQSPADSGYSVDNLAPATPAPFAAAYSSGATHLHWGANTEADFSTYRLYRGDTPGFTPGPGNLVVAQSDTGYADPGPAGSYYELTAVDFNGNESPYATLGPSNTTDVQGGAMTAFALRPIRPNPAGGGPITVEFVLPGNASATLELLDVAGRRVLEQNVGALGAGRHEVSLADAARLRPGLYLVRLSQGASVRTERVAVVH